MSRVLTATIILAIIILAIVLRVWGLGWGLPNDLHHYSYHPDENTVFSAAMSVDPLGGQLDPGFYNYGSMFLFIANTGIISAAMCGILNPAISDPAAQINEISKMYLAARSTALILGVLTVLIVYLIGRRLYGRWGGVMAALMMAVIPIHVMHSKFIAVDVPATLFIALTLLFTVRIAQENNRMRDYILAGLFAGLAAGTKYNAGLIIVSPIVIHLMTHKARLALRVFHPMMLGLLIPAAVGFIAGTPGAILNTEAFLRDFKYEIWHVSSGHGLVFTDTGLGWVYHFTHSLWPGMGLPLLGLAIIGFIYALWKHRPGDVALIAFLIVYYGLIGAAQVRFSRYIIPLFPVLVLLASGLLRDNKSVVADTITQDKSKENKHRNQVTDNKPQTSNLRYLWLIPMILVIAYTTCYSAASNRLLSSEDTRDTAAKWAQSNISPGSTIGLMTIPWFYTPPLDPEIALPMSSDERYARALEFHEYSFVVNDSKEWDPIFLEQEAPSYVILSEFEYTDRLRLKDTDALKCFDILERDYNSPQRYDQKLNCFGREFPVWADLPHDMSYPSPEILIYARKSDAPAIKIDEGENDQAVVPANPSATHQPSETL